MTNPVQAVYRLERYMVFQDVLANIVQTLGEAGRLAEAGHVLPPALPPRRARRRGVPGHGELFFTASRAGSSLEITTYLIVTQEAQRGQFVQYDPKKWLDFHSRSPKLTTFSPEKGISHRKLTKPEVNEYLHRFMAFHFQHGPFSMTNFKASDEYLRTGKPHYPAHIPLWILDEINLPR